MSDHDDNCDNYSSDEEYNEDESNDEEQDDQDYPAEEYTNNNSHFYDEQNRQLITRHSHSNSQHQNSVGSPNGDADTNLKAKPVPSIRNVSTSYVSLIKRTEDEMELVNRNSTNPRVHNISRNINGQNDKVRTKRRSHNAVTLLFGRSQGLPHDPTRQKATSTLRDQRHVRDGTEDHDIDFPLRNIAAGVTDNTVSIRDARALEVFAKKNLKLLKTDLQNAQLDVAEAKLGEFAAKLQARQVKIHERHAKLCKRRAVLRQAEEDQTALEKKLDDEEEDHRDRERRVKNRERRVIQEEATLRIKEAALRKREVAVSQGIEKIERWRKIVEEKEEVHKQMEDILEKKQEIHGKTIRNGRFFSSGGRRIKQGESKQQKRDTEVDGRKHDMLGHIISGMRRQQLVDHQSTSQGSARENSSSYHNRSNRNSSDIKSGAPSIWL